MEYFILNWTKEIWFIRLTSLYRVAMAGVPGAAGAEEGVLWVLRRNTDYSSRTPGPRRHMSSSDLDIAV